MINKFEAKTRLCSDLIWRHPLSIFAAFAKMERGTRGEDLPLANAGHLFNSRSLAVQRTAAIHNDHLTGDIFLFDQIDYSPGYIFRGSQPF